ncbi:MAG TPA: hypothetical protein VGC25_04830 [Alphaproteobacteria bacterium]|jgi:hypothetical protein
MKMTTGQWVFAGAGFLLALIVGRDLLPPGSLGLPNFLLAGLKGGVGAGLGLLAWEGVMRLRGENGQKDD